MLRKYTLPRPKDFDEVKWVLSCYPHLWVSGCFVESYSVTRREGVLNGRGSHGAPTDFVQVLTTVFACAAVLQRVSEDSGTRRVSKHGTD